MHAGFPAGGLTEEPCLPISQLVELLHRSQVRQTSVGRGLSLIGMQSVSSSEVRTYAALSSSLQVAHLSAGLCLGSQHRTDKQARMAMVGSQPVTNRRCAITTVLLQYSHRRALRKQRIGVRLSFLAEYKQTIVTLVRRIRCNGDETQKSQPQLLNARLLNARL
jgi:hypothetical protein